MYLCLCFLFCSAIRDTARAIILNSRTQCCWRTRLNLSNAELTIAIFYFRRLLVCCAVAAVAVRPCAVNSVPLCVCVVSKFTHRFNSVFGTSVVHAGQFMDVLAKNVRRCCWKSSCCRPLHWNKFSFPCSLSAICAFPCAHIVANVIARSVKLLFGE